MSKIQSLKQQKKYRNETMTILQHMNSKATTPTLTDKSLHNFKCIKPQVQSSRLNRPDTAKLYGKYGVNYYIGQIKDKEKRTDISQKVDKISSKSLESRQGSVNTHRKETDKTKKNSYSKLQTEEAKAVENQSWQLMIESMQNNLQKRLKHVEKLFSNKTTDSNHPESFRHKDKHTTQMYTNYLQIKQQPAQITRIKVPLQQKNPTQMIYEMKKKFTDFQSLLDQRKNKMIFDEIDTMLEAIINSLRSSFIEILDSLLKENEEKILDIQMSIQKIISDHEEELMKQEKKIEKIKENYISEIETMLVKSLYINDKINAIQERGIFNFEEIARRIDGGDSEYEEDVQQISQSENIQEDYSNDSARDYLFENQQIPDQYENYEESSQQSSQYEAQKVSYHHLVQTKNRSTKHGYIQKLR